MGYLRGRERGLPSDPILLWLHQARERTPIQPTYERGRVMDNIDIYSMDFDELMDYFGDGDPAEILG